MKSFPLKVASTSLELRPDRCLWWPEAQTLVASDLHWGKVHTFQAAGVALPVALEVQDLIRLDRALEQTGARRLLVLGDLVHSRQGMTPTLRQTIQKWRQSRPVRLVLVRGNHDRSAGKLPEEWEIEQVESLEEGPFRFMHEACEGPGYGWAGHLHPACTLRGRGDRLRLPCFVVGKTQGILPAFSEFSGGAAPPRGAKLYAVTGDQVIPVAAA